MTADTIAAISTAPGRGAIAVLRMSGPESVEIADRLFRGKESLARARSHSVRHGRLVDCSGRPLDEVLATVMRAPDTYTGEDVVEISCHGGVLVSQIILQALLDAGCRLAEPGEFTRRAFLNGRVDLAQAEAVAELVAAKTRRAAEFALRQLEGGLSESIRTHRASVVEVLAEVEARIDFPDDVPEPIETAALCATLDRCEHSLNEILSERAGSALLSAGARVPIIGKPNVGKSSLFNAIVGRSRVIVSPRPGTTRDTIEEEIDVEGIPVTLIDSAGLTNGSEGVEEEGVRRTMREIRLADLVILVLDASEGGRFPESGSDSRSEGRSEGKSEGTSEVGSRLGAEGTSDCTSEGRSEDGPEDRRHDVSGTIRVSAVPLDFVPALPNLSTGSQASTHEANTYSEDLEILRSVGKKPCLVVINKVDIGSPLPARAALQECVPDVPETVLCPVSSCGVSSANSRYEIAEVSAIEGTGLDSLKSLIVQQVTAADLDFHDAMCASQRHIDSLRSALGNIQSAKDALQSGTSEELVAFELREAAEELGSITGERVGQDILDSIFSRFCVGK